MYDNWIRKRPNTYWKMDTYNRVQLMLLLFFVMPMFWKDPENKVHGAIMGPTWVLSAPDGPHVGTMNLDIRGCIFCIIPLTDTFVGVNVFFSFWNCLWIKWCTITNRAITGPYCVCSNGVSHRIKPCDRNKPNWPNDWRISLNIWLVLSWLKIHCYPIFILHIIPNFTNIIRKCTMDCLSNS